MNVPDEIAFIIVTFLDIQHNLKVTRLINKQFYDVCQYQQLWKNISLTGFKTEYMNTIINNYGQKFRSLTIKQSRFGRKSCRLLCQLNNLVCLNLKKVYSNSLLDDRFCYLIRKLKLKKLLLGPSSISDVGLDTLKNIQLEEFELRHNHNITKRGPRLIAKWKGLKKLTLFAVVGVCFMHRLSKLYLEELEISFCHNLNSDSVLAFCKVFNAKLKKFLLYGHFVNKKMIKILSKMCPNIETFALCHPFCSQKEYNNIKYFKNMKFLSFICCKPVRNLKFLRTLRLQSFFICETKLKVSNTYSLQDFAKDLKNCKLIPIKKLII